MTVSQTPDRLWIWPDTIDSLYSSVCRESDFKPDENREGYVLYSNGDLAAMTAERNEWESEATLHRDLWLAATVARDALVGAAYAAAADHCWNKRDLLADAEQKQVMAGLTGRDYYGRRLEAELLSRSIRALTPADATTALDHMLAQAEARGRMEAWAEAAEVLPACGACGGSDAILAAAQKEAGK